ncbi:hypothetical protein C8J57DRAFT_1303504 [Mycena rebaudengoi]|nr:hypothetical protein C8J57DRAFT_1303504 [Mycena rebaudengoi]
MPDHTSPSGDESVICSLKRHSAPTFCWILLRHPGPFSRIQLSGPFQPFSLSFSILYAIHQPTPAVSHTPTQQFFRPTQYWSLRRICCLKGRGNPLGVGTHPLNSHFTSIDSLRHIPVLLPGDLGGPSEHGRFDLGQDASTLRHVIVTLILTPW